MLEKVICEELVSSLFNIVEDVRPTRWVLLDVPNLVEAEVQGQEVMDFETDRFGLAPGATIDVQVGVSARSPQGK
jgi:hypothetical protein